MLTTFSFPTKIVFGAGARRDLPTHLKALGARRPLLVTDSGLVRTEAFKEIVSLSNGAWPVFSEVQPNPALEDVEAATQAYSREKCDAVLAVGGGSALDVGKAIRLRLKRPDQPLERFDFRDDWTGLAPFVAVPTTAGTGSEVGRSSVIVVDGRKRVFFHPSLLAGLVVLDPELTVGLPPRLTAATGADALVHCIESFTSPVFHPLCDGIALEGLRLIADALPRAVKNGADIDARGKMLVAAAMGGIAFQKDLGATHSLAHPLSSLCGLHHGLANALCLPAVMKFNAARKPGVYRRMASVLELARNDDAAVIDFIEGFLRGIGIAPGLRSHGVNEKNIDALAAQAWDDSCHQTNPVPVTEEDLRALYLQSLDG